MKNRSMNRRDFVVLGFAAWLCALGPSLVAASPASSANGHSSARSHTTAPSTRATADLSPRSSSASSATGQKSIQSFPNKPADLPSRVGETPGGRLDLAPNRNVGPTVKPVERDGRPEPSTMHQYMEPGMKYQRGNTTIEPYVVPGRSKAIVGGGVIVTTPMPEGKKGKK